MLRSRNSPLHVTGLKQVLDARDNSPCDGLAGGQAGQAWDEALPQCKDALLLRDDTDRLKHASVLGRLAWHDHLRHEARLQHVHGAVATGADSGGHQRSGHGLPHGQLLLSGEHTSEYVAKHTYVATLNSPRHRRPACCTKTC